MELCGLVVRGLDFPPYRFISYQHLRDRNCITHFVPESAQSGRPWEALEWRPQHLIGGEPEVLAVVSLNGAGCTRRLVWNPGSPGADAEMGGLQKNPLIWKGLESAKEDKERVRPGWALVGRASSPSLQIPMAPPWMPAGASSPPSHTFAIHSEGDSQSHFSKM